MPKMSFQNLGVGLICLVFILIFALGGLGTFNNSYNVDLDESRVSNLNGSLVSIQANLTNNVETGQDAGEEIDITPTDDFSVRSTFQLLKSIISTREDEGSTRRAIEDVYSVEGQGVLPNEFWVFGGLIIMFILVCLFAVIFWRFSGGIRD